MKKVKCIFVMLLMIVTFTSCTENSRARYYGGTETVELNQNEIVLSVTWKGGDMWVCTKDTTTGIVYFREKSNFGLIEGAVVFK